MSGEILGKKLAEMSTAQRKIAKFIMDNPEEVALSTAKQLGARIGVSESSVIRFISMMGYDSYITFRRVFSEVVRGRLSTIVDRFAASAGEEDPLFYEKLIERDIQALENIRRTLMPQKLEDFVRSIMAAKTVYIAAYRCGGSLGNYLNFYLSLLLPDVRLLPLDLGKEILGNASVKDSLLISLTFYRYVRWTVDITHYALNRGINVISVTDKPSSPIVDGAQHVLYAPPQSVSIVDSFAVPMSILNCLIVALSRSMQDTASKRLEQVLAMWKDEGIYYEPDDDMK